MTGLKAMTPNFQSRGRDPGVCVNNGVKVNPEIQCAGDLDCASTPGAYCDSGFNISGAAFENTKIRGSGNSAGY